MRPSAPAPASGGLTIDARLRQLVEHRGHDAFVVAPSGGAVGGHETSFETLEHRSRRVADLLASLGVAKGDAVHVQLPNGVEFLTCLFGVAQLGAVLVPTNPSATVDDVAYVTSHASCAVSITTAERAPVVGAAREMAPEIGHLLVVGSAASEGVEGALDFAAAAEAAPSRRRPPATVDGGDVAAVLYTSGVTGWPKGVMITHANLLFVGDAVAAHLRIRPDDRWLVTLPLFHMNALGYSTMSALSAGASIALVAEFDPASWASLARDLDASLASLFAVHARRLVDAPPTAADGAGRLRFLLFAQHLTATERERLRERFGAVPLQVYGMTETVAPTLGDPPYGLHRPETVGQRLLWAPTRVADRTDRAVADGTEGELLVGGEAGRTLMAGYYRRPEQTALVLRNGWLHTGDRVVREPDGYYRFLGRAAEVIKPGVDNVSAPEIERVLHEHVSVTDAAVIGVRNAAGDEAVVAFVVLRGDDDDVTADEILRWSAERLADYKVPSRVEIIDALPRSAIGKVLKRELERRA